jgi:hypothetical protein
VTVLKCNGGDSTAEPDMWDPRGKDQWVSLGDAI